MNQFHLTADVIHLIGMILLLAGIWNKTNCTGVSGKSQFLLTLVFLTRHVDLLLNYISFYNAVFKIMSIVITLSTTISIFSVFKTTYSRQHDTFRIELLILPAAIGALFINHQFEIIEVLWTWSVYVEALAILPQSHLVSKAQKVERIVVMYVCALALYKSLYVMNWMYTYNFEGHYDTISVASGLVQVVFYCDFFSRITSLPKEVSRGNQERHVAVLEVSDNSTVKLNPEKSKNLFEGNFHTVILSPSFLANDKASALPSYEKATEIDVASKV